MLFVGGTQDGRNHKVSSNERISFLVSPIYPVHLATRAQIEDMRYLGGVRETYTRRTYTNNERDRSFVVMALESMSGDEVMHRLATGYYKNNPLKWANKT